MNRRVPLASIAVLVVTWATVLVSALVVLGVLPAARPLLFGVLAVYTGVILLSLPGTWRRLHEPADPPES